MEKVLFTSSYYSFSGFLDQKCLVMVTLGHGMPDHSSRNSSCVHIYCPVEVPILVSDAW